MKILVVSDTHGRDENFEQAVMQEAPFDMLIHCGDVEGREIFIEALTECPAISFQETTTSSQTFQEKK